MYLQKKKSLCNTGDDCLLERYACSLVELTDVSEVLAASIIRAISDLDDVSSMDL
jgi:hypothetical protein